MITSGRPISVWPERPRRRGCVCIVKSRRLAPNFHGSGFPSSFLARGDDASFAWRRNFVQTFVERDLSQLGVRIPAPTLSRFWAMLAHYHAQIWSGSEFARAR